MIAGGGTWCVSRTLPDGTRKVMLRDTERQARQAVAYCLVDNGLLSKGTAAQVAAGMLVGEDVPVSGYTFRLTRGKP